jgi:ferredoxin-NADP reductase
MTHKLTLQSIEPATHDTYHLVFNKSDGYDFPPPDQAADFALDRDGWRDRRRPFTFTGPVTDPKLKFVITPFIAILNRRSPTYGSLDGSIVVFAYKTERDIIVRKSFTSMRGVECHFLVSDDPHSELDQGMIDKANLECIVAKFDGPFYICGSGPKTDAVRAALQDLGVAEDRIITEDLG